MARLPSLGYTVVPCKCISLMTVLYAIGGCVGVWLSYQFAGLGNWRVGWLGKWAASCIGHRLLGGWVAPWLGGMFLCGGDLKGGWIST